MVIDARRVPNNERVETDLCIIGAGAAGITLAREFANQSLRVCLVESGGQSYSRQTQSLYRGENRGAHHWPLVQSRIRTYGGSTTAWDGRCRPLDPIDFEVREWVPHSGWPFGKAELDPYYERAAAVIQLNGSWNFKTGASGPDTLFEGKSPLETIFFHYARVLNFAKAYGPEIEKAKNMTVFLHANATEIAQAEEAGRIDHLQVKTLDGNQFSIAAQQVVLAAGGVENARLLLASNRGRPAGLGNQHDLVGRYLMNHPHQFFATLNPAPDCPPLQTYITPFHQTKTVTGAWAFGAKQLRSDEHLNAAVYLVERAAHKSTPAYLSPAMTSLNTALEALKRGNLPDDPGWHLRKMMGGVGAISASFGQKLLSRSNPLVLRVALENAPNPNSRVTLSRQRDSLGQNRACIDWQLSEIDWRSYQLMVRLLVSEFDRTGFGRVQPFFNPDGEPWSLPVQDGKHHMGATRMHTDPRQGVVDPQCRVHGIANLAIAGSSVFPTGGHANPTFTIVALSLRLADHLKRKLYL